MLKWSQCSSTYQVCTVADWSRLMLLTTSCINAAHPGPSALMEQRESPPGSVITCVGVRECVFVCVCVCAVCMGIHASTQRCNPAPFVFLTYKLQNDPSEKLLLQQTVHPSAPPCCSWAACVCCVCECLWPVCNCLCVFEPIGSFSLALEVDRKSRGVSFLRTCRSGGQGGCILELLLITVGTFWREREFEPGHWERRLHCVTSVTNHMLGRLRYIFVPGSPDPLVRHQTGFYFLPGRNSHDCRVCLCFCEPDPAVLLSGSSKHVIVLTQMRGWNGTRQTRGVLLSG